jgi:nucleoside-diphosphate-sugar epimerase
MSVFITGGTGFIGKKLIEKLWGKESLHLLVRPQSNRCNLKKEGIRFFPGDITDEHSVVEGMQGCEKVYHLAAYAKNFSFDKEAYYKINILGAIHVFESALKNNVRKVVFTSSCVSLGPSQNKVVTEKDWKERNHFYTEYEKSKYLAEVQALKFVEKGLDLVIVNPTRVYGPGELSEANSVSKIVERYIKGRFPIILNQGKEIGNYAFVEDVASGLILAMEKGKAGERYILGSENVSLKNFFALIDEILQAKHKQINISPKIAKFFGWLEEKKAYLLKKYPSITPDWVDTFLQNWAFSSEKAEKELGYKYHSLKEGLRITCDWLLNSKNN